LVVAVEHTVAEPERIVAVVAAVVLAAISLVKVGSWTFALEGVCRRAPG